MSQPFVGEIKLVGFSFPPRGYMSCIGTLLPISQQQALFALLGTTFGGNGVQTFGIPDFRGRVPVGQGQGPGLSNYVQGEMAGVETNSILLTNLPPHNHPATTTVTPSSTLAATTVINALTAPSARVVSPAGNLLTGAQVSISGVPTNVSDYAAPGTGTAATLATNAATTTLTGGVTATAQTTVGLAGSGIPLGNLQPYLGTNYIIALEGIFPSRN